MAEVADVFRERLPPSSSMRPDAALGLTRRPTAAPCEPTLVEGLVKIRTFARVVDLEWQRALQRGAPADAVMALGEASLALHRAVIALADAPPFAEVRDWPVDQMQGGHR